MRASRCTPALLAATWFAVSCATATGAAPKPVATTPPVPVTAPVVHYRLSAVFSVKLSPRGGRLAVGVFHRVLVYDTATWKLLSVCTSVSGGARAIAFTPDGKTIAIGCGLPDRDGEALIWDGVTGHKPTVLKGADDVIEALAFSNDGKTLVTASDDHDVRVYQNLPSAKNTMLTEHNDQVQAVAFSPNAGIPFLSGGRDHMVKAWDQKTLHSVANLDQYGDGVTCVQFINDTQFVAGSLDGHIYWAGIGYDNRDKAWGSYFFRDEFADDGGVNDLAVTGNRQIILTCGMDGAETMWQADGRQLRVDHISHYPFYGVDISSDGKTAYGGGRDGMIYQWNTGNGSVEHIQAPPPLRGLVAPQKRLAFHKVKPLTHRTKHTK